MKELFLCTLFNFRKRKGFQKPIYIMAALALAIMFVAAYYAAVNGWLGDVVGQFNTGVQELGKK